MTYTEAISLLYASLPVYQNIGPGAYKPGLGNAEALDEMFGHPHHNYPTIHIAGTNGKGSTAHTLAAILTAAGYRTGLYTSPHIFDFRERIRVDGRKIEPEAVSEFVEEWTDRRPDGLHPSFFELTSTMAFRYFADKQVDVAVIETGLGGRLDSTNIITPVLSVITNISLDHTALLGDTPAQIAWEKAGIMKPKVPVVIGEWTDETLPVFTQRASVTSSPLIKADRLDARVGGITNIYPDTPFGPLEGELTGDHQVLNAATVLKAVETLRQIGFTIPDDAVREGFRHVVERTGLFGRWSRIMESPETIADTGHNCGGWEKIASTLNKVKSQRKALVVGFVADKKLAPVFDIIKGLDDHPMLWFSQPSAPRGLSAESLAQAALQSGLHGHTEPDVNKCLAQARMAVGPDGFVLVAGSNFLIADLKLPEMLT
ncbi:MAG: bifunctional folylpolyglutamate synthase/dihydrofolate synthase [Muribaculaceae bacterium]|nr:bifunctional folylpolyglutamate synthase/dihydrofolate synthase [Muribaculaceae bacterium]